MFLPSHIELLIHVIWLWLPSVVYNCWDVQCPLFSSCCCLLACSRLPDVPHSQQSKISKKAEYQMGDMIRFICDTGYISGPSISYKCNTTSGNWTEVRKASCYCELKGFLLHSLFCCIFSNQVILNVNNFICWNSLSFLLKCCFTDFWLFWIFYARNCLEIKYICMLLFGKCLNNLSLRLLKVTIIYQMVLSGFVF